MLARLCFRLAVCAAGLGLVTLAAAPGRGFQGVEEGPGLGNLRYDQNQVMQPIAMFNARNGAPRALGSVAMHGGYLAVVYSAEGRPRGGFSFYDVSNPRSPQLVSQWENEETRPIREAHGFGFSHSYGGRYVALQAEKGIQFWDWTDVRSPRLLSYLEMRGLTASAYGASAWWVFWQAPYIYLGGGSSGIYVIDARDPSRPQLVRRMPIGEIGGFPIGPVFAVGNLLVATTMNEAGYATLDISDPERPVLIAATRRKMPDIYATMLNGNRIYGTGRNGLLYAHDITDPTRFRATGSGVVGFDSRGGYVTLQDNFAHVGASDTYAKFNIRTGQSFALAGKGTSGINNRDEDFATVFGNLVFVGNDHGQGSALIPHQASPDKTGPEVNMVVPRRNQKAQPVTTRIGVTLTDNVDLRTVNSSTFIVRPVGGAALPGKYSGQSGILNFSPDAPLRLNTVYEIVIPAGGLRDDAGNPIRRAFRSRFSTAAGRGALTVELDRQGPAPVGSTLTFEAKARGKAGLRYSWNFGDGSRSTAFRASPRASYTFSAPGHYSVQVTVRGGNQQKSAAYVQTIYVPSTAALATASGTIAFDDRTNRIWVANADSDTVTAVDAASLQKVTEVPVGRHPRTLSRAPDGTLWVACQDSASLSVLDPEGRPVQTVPLPRGSQPYGVAFAPDGSAAYVTLQGMGRLLVLDPLSRTVRGEVHVGPSPRGIAASADGRVLVTRFISPAERGEVVEVDPASLSVTRIFALEPDLGPDTEAGGRGIPNYLSSITLSPDGRRAWIPSKKDNTLRGLQRDGKPLTFESTVRTIVSQIDLSTNAEDLRARVDLNDREMATAVAFSPLGDYAFVATQGSNAVDVLDAYTGQLVTAIEETGLAPQGLTVAGERLYVQNFMSRSLSVYDVSGILTSTNETAEQLASVSTVQQELLEPQVLLGKQIFYNAADPRMSRDSYLSCASCHLDGGSDGRIWDFTDRGEGLRNTIQLQGRRGTGHGRLHWTANFDEVQDFEHDIRDAFGGTGFLPDELFNSGTRNTPLGDPKAGQSADLDALAAYVASLSEVSASPFRNADGTLTPDGVAGRELFVRLECGSCHSGPDFTDSPLGLVHDVGTLKPSSGSRAGQPLTCIDTPTLRGLWETAPYLHDGSAATLFDVLTTANSGDRHGRTSGLTEEERRQLVSYLLQLDGPETPGPAPTRAPAFRQSAAVSTGAHRLRERPR